LIKSFAAYTVTYFDKKLLWAIFHSSEAAISDIGANQKTNSIIPSHDQRQKYVSTFT